MDNKYYNDKNFQNSSVYKDFLVKNAGLGSLKIRAYAASEALPISDLLVIISTIIDNKKIIFFEGSTDSSGMIETLKLPAPLVSSNNLLVPDTITYEIDTKLGDIEQKFNVDMYDGICVLQNIKFVSGGDLDGN